MEEKNYICIKCMKSFGLLNSFDDLEAVRCPRCSNKDVQELNTCSLGTNPPPWEYVCQQCGIRFWVTSLCGPSEERTIRCPNCESRNIMWLATAGKECPPGG